MTKFTYMVKINIRQSINWLINKRETTGLKDLNDFKAFIEYSDDVDDVWENIEEYNPNKKHILWNVYDDVIADC